MSFKVKSIDYSLGDFKWGCSSELAMFASWTNYSLG